MVVQWKLIRTAIDFEMYRRFLSPTEPAFPIPFAVQHSGF
jgi:hypothetical protein